MKGIILKVTKSTKSVEEYSIKLNKTIGVRSIQIQLLPAEAKKYIEYSEIITDDSYPVKINSNLLDPGTIKYAEIQAFDPSNPSIESIFHLPITVISPQLIKENNSIQKEIVLKPLIPYRFFIQTPKNVDQCKIDLSSLTEELSKESKTKVIIKYSVEDSQVCDENGKTIEFVNEDKYQRWEIPIMPEKMYELLFLQRLYNVKDLKFKIKLSFRT
uniref:Uncharacterized protein n=1 Tax=Panagrolaimus sp. ES5 TaxID=591445 RepID=A0AC34FVJ6_9BILA